MFQPIVCPSRLAGVRPQRSAKGFLLLGVCIALLSAPRAHALSPAATSPAPAGSPSTVSTDSSATTAPPEFEAATIKPVKEPDPNNRINDRREGRRYTVRNATLQDLILLAYGLDRQQIAGGPAWTATDEYDVVAVAQSDTELVAHGDEMMKTLLAERFQLKFHWEQRERSVYALLVAKGGPTLKTADASEKHSEKHGAGCTRLGNCSFQSEALQHFARWMGYVVLDRSVVDKTGLAGEFDFTLKWTPDETQFGGIGFHIPPPPPTDSANAPPGLFTAIQEQLGLKLEPQKTPAPVVVIDHVERPSAN